MRVSRPSLVLYVVIGLFVFYGVLAGLTVNALADESASPAPSPSISLPTPSPSPTAEAPNHHLWSKHWAKQARHNRLPLKRLSRCLMRPLPRLETRPGSGASDRQWNRYGHRCYNAAVRFVKLKSKWHRLVFQPVVVNYMDWAPCVRYYWPANQVATAMIVIRTESGGRANASGAGGMYRGLFQLCSSWWGYCGSAGPYNGPANIRAAAKLQRECGWGPWPWL